jgi:hypothetical protein
MTRLYAVTHAELSSTLKTEEEESPGEFREQRRRKRNPSEERPKAPKKMVPAAVPFIHAKNFFAPFRTKRMDTDATSMETANTQEKAPAGKAGIPPPIILTTPTNLIQLQKQLKDVVAETFEFRHTRNGTRVLTKSLADFQSVKSYFDQRQLFYFSFFPKSEKLIKALPINIPAEDISDGLVSLGLDVISVKQMTTTRRSAPDDPKSSNLPLFLIILPERRNRKRSSDCQASATSPSRWRRTEPGMASRSAITASSSAMYGLAASRFHSAYGTGAVTCIRSAPRMTTHPHPRLLKLQVGGRRKTSSRQLSLMQPRQGGAAEEAATEVPQAHN